MSMSFERYTRVRERLIELYEIIVGRIYEVWIAPASLMSIEQIRNRETITLGDSSTYDDEYTDYQKRRLTIKMICDKLDTINSHRDIGFIDANNSVVEIYESVQEYIRLWLEIRRDIEHFQTATIDELRRLEGIAYLVFPIYKQVKSFSNKLKLKEMTETSKSEGAYGLAGLGSIMMVESMGGPKLLEEISFVSHIDDYENASDLSSANISSYENMKLSNLAASIVKETEEDKLDLILGLDDSASSWVTGLE